MLVHSLQMSVQICPAPGSWDITPEEDTGAQCLCSGRSKHEVGKEAQSFAGLESLDMKSDAGEKWGYRPQARTLHLW